MNSPRIILRFVKRLCDRLFFVLCRFLFPPLPQSSPNRILIVRTDGIGDFVFFSRYLPAIRKRFAGDKIVLCCRTEVASVARLLPMIDALLEVNLYKYHYNYFYRFGFLRKIRSFAPTLGIYATFHRSHTGDEMVLFSGATETIAFSGNNESIHPSMRRRDDLYFSNIVEVPDHSREHDKYVALLKSVGIDGALHPEVSAIYRDVDLGRAAEDGSVSQVLGPRRYAVLAPGSGGMIRRWPARNFSLLADKLVEKFGVGIVLCAGAKEQQLVTEIANEMHNSAKLHTQLTLVEVMALMKKASFFVGNDSGLLHLAASTNTPSIGVIGGGHFKRYFPYGSVRVANHPLDCYECNWKCIYPEPYCITNISVEDVLKEVRNLHIA